MAVSAEQLPSDFCTSLCTRLSEISNLLLPSAVYRDSPGRPATGDIKAFLTGLLQRDAAVFLERYGNLLSSEELSNFQPLRDNYEINYWLNQAEQKLTSGAVQQQQQQQRANGASGSSRNRAPSKTAANRRLAYMHKLEQQGEYFSYDSMRAREPLVFWEHIGQYEGMPPPPSGRLPGEDFAGSLLRAHDEVLVRARLQQQLEEEECQASEHESDSEDDVEQQQQQQKGGDAEEDEQLQDAAAPAAGLSSNNQQQQQQQQQQGPGCSRQHHEEQEEHQQLSMGADAMRQRRQDFLEEMQSRFLLGMDGEHQEYASIDADVSLDDAWAAQQAQDAEDAYFDAD